MSKVKVDEQLAAHIYAVLVGSATNRGDKIELETLVKTSFAAAEVFAVECASRKPKLDISKALGKDGQ